MKKESNFKNYYEEYLEICNSVISKSDKPDSRDLVKEKTNLMDFSLPFGTCILDYSTRKYIYLSNHSSEIIGNPRELYVEGGLDFHNSIWHPDDKVIFATQIFRDIKQFWSKIEPMDFPNYRFSFNYRFFQGDDRISHLCQYNTYLEPQNGIPLLNLVVFSDISDFKTDNIMILTISKYMKGFGYIKVFSKSYNPKQKSKLSVRETEILRLSLEGMSNKLIADKLFISLNTVKHHKQNMMEKTCAKNILDLINLSQKNHWI